VVGRKCVVDGHVGEEREDIFVEERLNEGVVEVGIDEQSSKVGLDDVW
jgi:hypothetical protein